MKKWRASDYDELIKAQWEQEQQRPYDWQDKLVIIAAYIAIAFFLVLMVTGCAAYDAFEKGVAIHRVVTQ